MNIFIIAIVFREKNMGYIDKSKTIILFAYELWQKNPKLDIFNYGIFKEEETFKASKPADFARARKPLIKRLI